jgi:hypothetical protein
MLGIEAVRREYLHVPGLAHEGALTWTGRNLAILLNLKILLSPAAQQCLTGDNKMDPSLWKILARINLHGCASAQEAVGAINKMLEGVEPDPAAHFFADRFNLSTIFPPTDEHAFLLDCSPIPVFRMDIL